jgi:hypothetical protein
MASMIFSSILWSSLRCRPVDHLGGVWIVGKQYSVWEMIEDGLLRENCWDRDGVWDTDKMSQ